MSEYEEVKRRVKRGAVNLENILHSRMPDDVDGLRQERIESIRAALERDRARLRELEDERTEAP